MESKDYPVRLEFLKKFSKVFIEKESVEDLILFFEDLKENKIDDWLLQLTDKLDDLFQGEEFDDYPEDIENFHSMIQSFTLIFNMFPECLLITRDATVFCFINLYEVGFNKVEDFESVENNEFLGKIILRMFETVGFIAQNRILDIFYSRMSEITQGLGIDYTKQHNHFNKMKEMIPEPKNLDLGVVLELEVFLNERKKSWVEVEPNIPENSCILS